MTDIQEKFWDLVRGNNEETVILSATRELLESITDDKEREDIVNWKNPDEVSE
jgi:hypothetical protein